MRDRDEGEFFAASLDFDDKDSTSKESPKQLPVKKINLCGESLTKLKYCRPIFRFFNSKICYSPFNFRSTRESLTKDKRKNDAVNNSNRLNIENLFKSRLVVSVKALLMVKATKKVENKQKEPVTTKKDISKAKPNGKNPAKKSNSSS